MKTQQRAEDTRASLLQAARECFALHGYDATGVAEICAAAGVSKGAFYHHFPSKQALFVVLLNDWLAALDVGFSAIRASAPSTVEALQQMSAMIGPIFREQRGQLPMLFEFWTQARRDPVVWQAAIAPYHRYQTLFAEMVRQGIAAGQLKPADPEHVAQMLVSLAIGLLLQAMLDPDGADWGDVAQDSVRLFLRGLFADPI